MTIENIQCFVHLAECLNFARAAEKDHVTQSAMSRKIGSLEEELGVVLFLRDNRQVELTKAGKQFYSEALKLLDEYFSAVQLVQNIASGFQKDLRIGIGVYEHILMNRFLGAFIALHPEVKISCCQFSYNQLMRQFEQHALDVIITSDQFLSRIPTDEIEKTLICSDSWDIAIPTMNPLSTFDIVSRTQLKDQILISMYDGNIEQICDYYRHAFSVNFKDIIHVNSYEAKLSLINANLGIGLFPPFVEPFVSEQLVFRKLYPAYYPRKFYAVCWKQDANDLTTSILELCKQFSFPTSQP